MVDPATLFIRALTEDGKGKAAAAAALLLALSRLHRADPASVEAIHEIAEERIRQIEIEGWTPEHDDQHGNGEMAAAAARVQLHYAWDAGGE